MAESTLEFPLGDEAFAASASTILFSLQVVKHVRLLSISFCSWHSGVRYNVSYRDGHHDNWSSPHWCVLHRSRRTSKFMPHADGPHHLQLIGLDVLLKPGNCQVCLTTCGDRSPTIVCNVGVCSSPVYNSFGNKGALALSHFNLLENGHIIQGTKFGGCIRYLEVPACEAMQVDMLASYHLDALEASGNADVTFHIGSSRIDAHSVVLMRIPHFRSLLAEARIGDPTLPYMHIHEDERVAAIVNNVDATTFVRVLRYLYTDDVGAATIGLDLHGAISLARAATLYGMQSLLRVAEAVVLKLADAGQIRSLGCLESSMFSIPGVNVAEVYHDAAESTGMKLAVTLGEPLAKRLKVD
mmetsp:Transcript_1793/g.3090  ORF Transcript_1793/g.3090 Transcript_1793/m.3090 type:complete len:355 (-) Transcript_1793:41-1105(-)